MAAVVAKALLRGSAAIWTTVPELSTVIKLWKGSRMKAGALLYKLK